MSYIIEATEKTPGIKINSESGKISISGISVPENPYDFYAKMIEEIDVYLKSPEEVTEFTINLEYFNTSTALVIRNILRKLEPLSKSAALKVTWLYEENDEDMFEAGSEYKFLFKDLDFVLSRID